MAWRPASCRKPSAGPVGRKSPRRRHATTLRSPPCSAGQLDTRRSDAALHPAHLARPAARRCLPVSNRNPFAVVRSSCMPRDTGAEAEAEAKGWAAPRPLTLLLGSAVDPRPPSSVVSLFTSIEPSCIHTATPNKPKMSSKGTFIDLTHSSPPRPSTSSTTANLLSPRRSSQGQRGSKRAHPPGDDEEEDAGPLVCCLSSLFPLSRLLLH